MLHFFDFGVFYFSILLLFMQCHLIVLSLINADENVVINPVLVSVKEWPQLPVHCMNNDSKSEALTTFS